MKKQKFTADISQFYDVHLNNGEHEICYFRQRSDESLIQKEISLPQKEIYFGRNILSGLLRFYRAVRSYDYIAFHSYLYPYWLKGFLALVPGIVKKLIWIEWGADLYTWKSDNHGPLGKLKNHVEKKLRTKCAAAVCIFPPDCDHYRQEFPNSRAKVYYAPYCGAEAPEEYRNYDPHSRLAESSKNSDTIYIQVGHSATPAVQHIRVLDMLKRFADRNIRIFLPLSYGDELYAEKVRKYAEELFPGKVICLREMMPKQEYFELLRRVDIAVFHTYRQIALGNIKRMLFRNVKIYMPENSVMYRYFSDNSAPVQKSEELESCSFEELISVPVAEDQGGFEQFLSSFSDMDTNISLWRAIYDDLRGQIKQ